MRQRPDAVAADGEGHGAERAQRRRAHDDSDDAEQGAARLIQHMNDVLAALTHARQAQAEQHREQQDLQDLALG